MTAINQVTDLDVRDGIAILTLNSPPVNALSGPVLDGLHKGVKQAIDDPAVKAIVLVCAGRTFIAGADITELGSGGPQGASLTDVQDMMEGSSKPMVAAIHGTALGGGLEVALCCHYRGGGRLGAVRPAGSQAWPAAGRGRHAAAAPDCGRGNGAGDDGDRRSDWRGQGAGGRTDQRDRGSAT